MAQISHSLSYKLCSITLPKFNTFGLFILILGTSAIMDQTACCYNVTTPKAGIYLIRQSRISWNSKLINVCFDSSAQRLMVETTQKSDFSLSAIFCVIVYWTVQSVGGDLYRERKRQWMIKLTKYSALLWTANQCTLPEVQFSLLPVVTQFTNWPIRKRQMRYISCPTSQKAATLHQFTFTMSNYN